MTVPTKWKCEVCGYIHDGAEPPEICPVCGVGPEMFSRLAEEAEKSGESAAEAWKCTICDEVISGAARPGDCPVCGATASLFDAHTETQSGVPQGTDAVRIVILGGGVAGFTAADYARRNSAQATITLVHKEHELPYNRLNLTRFLGGEVEEEDLELREPSWYSAQRIDLFADEAVRIDRQESRVELRKTPALNYDRLILANGSHPFVPPIVGVTLGGVFSLRTKADAIEILARAKINGRCVCVGGGLLGLEVAGALVRRGVRVTVLEGFDRLLPRQLAEPAGVMLKSFVEGKGIDVKCGARTEAFFGDEEVRGVRLRDGTEIPADLVVLATGVRPNSYLARQCGLEVNNGVLVDDNMRTSDPSILAAGDVAEHRGLVYGLWPTALGQGAVAGNNAAGGQRAVFAGIPPANQLKVLEVDLFSIGQFAPPDASYRVFERQEDSLYYRLVCRDGKLVGANLFGNTEHAGVVKSAVETGTQIAELDRLLQSFRELVECI